MLNRYNATAYRQELLPYSVPYLADSDDLINILLIEDDYNDTLLTIQKINAAQVPYNLDRITHGDDVLPYLHNCMQTRLPDILFLDLGLPGIDGFDILNMLDQAPAAMRAVPIAIITGQSHFDYLAQTYNGLPIYGCLTKPLHSRDISPILAKVADGRE